MPSASDSRATWLAAVTIGLAMAGHQIAETARDALFLGELGPTQLPYVYLALAALGVPFAFLRVSPSRPLIALALFFTAPVTASFAWTARIDPMAYRLLYVWTGLSTTMLVTYFWLFLSDHHSVTRAKLTFPRIALGGIIGALVGASGARLLTEVVDTPWLLVAAGGCTFVAGIVATVMQRAVTATDELASRPRVEKPPARGRRLEAIKRAYQSRYARVVGLLLVTAAVTFTLLDYTFKAYVAANVAKADLGGVFATFYIVLNASALIAQIVIARRLLVWIGLGTVVLFIPILVTLGAVGVLAGGGIVAALALKGVDGTLKHSLHRTSTELLFVPMSRSIRAITKPAYDIVGQRGGQAFASLLILGVLYFTHDVRAFAAATGLLALLWIVAGLVLRRRYLGVFRRTLQEGSIEDVSLPELGVEELKAMIEALNSEQDGKVIGAIDVLDERGHTATIPDLILYHPSPDVVIHALRVFRRTRRARAKTIARRLLKHTSGAVRAEALLLLAATDDGHETYVEPAALDSARMRGIKRALLLRSVAADASVAWSELLAPEDAPLDVEEQLGIASAFAYLPPHVRRSFEPDDLTDLPPNVQTMFAKALSEEPTVRELPLFIALLAVRGARVHSRRALTTIGAPAFKAAVAALRDKETPLAVRVHLPRTLSRFPPEDAAPVLLDCVVQEDDELVLHKALRGLGRIKATHPDLPLDDERLSGAYDHVIRETLRLLAVRVILRGPNTNDDTHPIRTALLALLDEAERRGMEHVFRLLHLRHPAAGLEDVFRGATSSDERQRISASEILTDVVDLRLRGDILALASTASDAERLEGASMDAWSDIVDETTALKALCRGSGPLAQAAERYAAERSNNRGRAA